MKEEEMIEALVDNGFLCQFCNQPEDCMRCNCNYAWHKYWETAERKLANEADTIEDSDPLFVLLPGYSRNYDEKDYEWGFGYGDEESCE